MVNFIDLCRLDFNGAKVDYHQGCKEGVAYPQVRRDGLDIPGTKIYFAILLAELQPDYLRDRPRLRARLLREPNWPIHLHNSLVITDGRDMWARTRGTASGIEVTVWGKDGLSDQQREECREAIRKFAEAQA
jgi:hypothetical protein